MSRTTFRKQPSMFAFNPDAYESMELTQTEKSTAIGSDRSDTRRSVSPRRHEWRSDPVHKLTGNESVAESIQLEDEESDENIRYRLATPDGRRGGNGSDVESSEEDRIKKVLEGISAREHARKQISNTDKILSLLGYFITVHAVGHKKGASLSKFDITFQF